MAQCVYVTSIIFGDAHYIYIKSDVTMFIVFHLHQCLLQLFVHNTMLLVLAQI